MNAKQPDEQFSKQETAHRRDAVIKLMLATPPKLHSEMKIGKPSGKKKMSPGKRKRLSRPAKS